jgi:hypothetical protein
MKKSILQFCYFHTTTKRKEVEGAIPSTVLFVDEDAA